MIEGIADLVERWALERPVLLAVEDLHWADDATIQTLDRLARRLQHVGVLIVGTARPHPRPAALRVLERTLANVGATLIELEPLPEELVIELAGQVLGGQPGPMLTEALAQAGGNPLYVTELLAAARAQMPDGRGRLGPAQRPAAAACIERCRPADGSCMIRPKSRRQLLRSVGSDRNRPRPTRRGPT